MDAEIRSIKWWTYFGDFVNTLKAFIGTNYQALPFAFSNSGLAFGIAGVFIIATLTDHCCQLLLATKKRLIEKICSDSIDMGSIDEADAPQLKARLDRTVGYGDLGRRVFGPSCFHLIQLAVCFTQFTTCISYFIFIGNTVYEMFPLSLSNYTPPINGSQRVVSSELDVTENSGVIDALSDTVATSVSLAPDLRLIILWAVPIFLVTSLVRNIRYLAPLSFIASIGLALGIVSVLCFVIKGFTIDPTFEWYRFATLPLFFTQLISAYEGIGCILPIHCSMVGCEHMLWYYIHASVYLIFFVLCSFGVLGYLRYGPHVEQLLVQSITQHTPLSLLVDVTLLISVVFTYPLQCYPVIEILERYILTPGQCCGNGLPIRKEYDEIATGTTPPPHLTEESESLLTDSLTVELTASRVSRSAAIQNVAAWKRNTLRILLTLVTAGLAVLLRNGYAYVGSFTGAVGCSLLALILPCMLDMKLHWDSISTVLLIKDICIITFAVVVSVSGLVMITITVIKGERPV